MAADVQLTTRSARDIRALADLRIGGDRALYTFGYHLRRHRPHQGRPYLVVRHRDAVSGTTPYVVPV